MPTRICPGAAIRLAAALGRLSVLPILCVVTQPKPASAAAAAHVPGSRKDCAATSKALHGQAEALAKRGKQIIPREFERVSSNLDDYCDEGDFEKARVSIDWMNTCLKNFAKSYQLGFCFRNTRYFCAVDPQSDDCLRSR
jgi:uncharacterized protein YsxB (DUF464 family)